jgi:hypothetical protein
VSKSKYGRRRLKLKCHDAQPSRRSRIAADVAAFRAVRRADPIGARNYDLKN